MKIGIREIPDNTNSDRGGWIDSINKAFRLSHQPWCAMGASVTSKGLTYPSVWSARAIDFSKIRSYSLNSVLWKVYIPKPGDWVVYNYGGGKGHIDVIEYYDSTKMEFHLIGCNRSNAVRRVKFSVTEAIMRNAKYVINVAEIFKPEPIKYKFDTIPVHATWYGGWFHSKKTASGERYDTTKFTGAHRTLKFGTVVKVYNPKNRLSVFVRINDRCPKSNVLDLTPAAARKLKLTSSKVKMVVRQIAG